MHSLVCSLTAGSLVVKAECVCLSFMCEVHSGGAGWAGRAKAKVG